MKKLILLLAILIAYLLIDSNDIYAADSVEKLTEVCPYTYTISGGFCIPSNNSPLVVKKIALQCPPKFRIDNTSGYCIAIIGNINLPFKMIDNKCPPFYTKNPNSNYCINY